MYLDYFQTGAADEAVKTEEQALAMLPPVASGAKPTGLRSEIEGHWGLLGANSVVGPSASRQR